jgi:hypothetical protein
MDGVEGLGVVRFGIPPYLAAGVIVLETERFFGGDSMYYYVGDYKAHDGKITGSGKVVLHDFIPGFGTIFGDQATHFSINLSGTIGENSINGAMVRPDLPNFPLPVFLEFQERLP